MKTKILLSVLALIMCSACLNAQSISGYVFDAKDGEPIIGATVSCGSQRCLTDFDGHFSLNVSQGSKITVSYIGYKSKKVSAQSNMQIGMGKGPYQLIKRVPSSAYANNSTQSSNVSGSASAKRSSSAVNTGRSARKSAYTIERDGNVISCESKKLLSYDSKFIITFGINVAPDGNGRNVIGASFYIVSLTSEKLVRIARSLKGYNKGVSAVYKLSNGEVYTLYSQGEDVTSDDFKKSNLTSAIEFFSLFTQNNVANPAMVAKFRLYNIESIKIGDGVIDFKNDIGLTTAPIIDEMCRELENNGVDAKSFGK